ncbi:MAG: hypothetical protein L6R40_000174 [Gallowayella cf. fulva]|nr:MAG: hypothetical protein L6R40_000174 [Xanthomendoza cf. fulva]
MEPLSIAASLLTVLEATASVSKSTIALYRNVREAPKELAQLSTRVSQTRSRLAIQIQLYQSLNGGSTKSLLPDGALVTFQADLENAKDCLGIIKGIRSAKGGGKQCLSWVMQDKRKVTKVLLNLHDIDNNISALLTTLSLAINLHSNELVSKLNTHQQSLAAQLQRSHQDTRTYSAYSLLPTSMAGSVDHDPSSYVENTMRTSIAVGQQKDELRAEFLKILLAYWPMPNALDLDGPVGPLACAAMKGSVEDLDLLMHTGVCVSNTAMIAKKIIKYSMLGSNLATSDYLMPLLPSGWINQTDQRGRGPLHVTLLCLGFHIKEIAQRLLVAGANVHLRDMDGNDPGDVARICDEQALSDGILQPASSGNVRAYYDALITEGFDVELDRDGILWWPSYDPTP